MKGILAFNLPEDAQDFKLATKAPLMASALWDIRQKVFRPARKHGYGFDALKELTERDILIIQLLEGMFNEVLREHELEELDL